MKRIASTSVAVSLVSFVLGLPLAGCSSGGGGSVGSSGDGGAARASSSTSPAPAGASSGARPSGATSVTCSTADDCGNWFCDCTDGPVNARNCTNGYCLDAEHTCPSACQKWGVQWTGSASGGPSQTRPPSPSPSPSSSSSGPGDGCSSHADCPQWDCTCSNGFTTQYVTTRSCDVTKHTCRSEAQACPDACSSQGLEWVSD